MRSATLVEIRAASVVYRVGGDERSAPADDVVLAGGICSHTALADQLRTAGLDVRVVGDAGAVDDIEGAIHSAWRIVLDL